MKKLTLIILSALLLLSCLTGCGSAAKTEPATEDPAPVYTFAFPDREDEEEKTGWEIYDEVYASHDPNEVVLKVNGSDVTWDHYFYRLFQLVNQYAQYGEAWDWATMVDAGISIEQFTKQSIEETVAQYTIICDKAAELGITLSETSRAEVEAVYEDNLTQLAGGDEEKFAEALRDFYVTPERYRWILETSALYADMFSSFYGSNGEKVTEEEIDKFIEDTGYMHCMHILLLTTDGETGAALEEGAIAERRAQAEELLAQLREVEDDPEALLAKFRELMSEYSEDPGTLSNPEGYYFGPGKMVEEFENGTAALGMYELSDIIETSYGYHIILRLPIGYDDIVDGTYTMRYYTAADAFNALTADWFTNYEVEYMPEFADMDFVTMFPQEQ